MAMAGTGTLSFSQFSVHRPVSFSRTKLLSRNRVCIRAMSETETSSSTSTSVSITPPPNFKPPQPKRFAIRSDKTFEILGASLPLLFRFATGVFVSG